MAERPIQLSWGHININVTDLDRSIAFYELLGFTLFVPAIGYLGLAVKTDVELAEPMAGALGLPPGTRGRACIMQLGDGFPKLDLTELHVNEQRQPSTTSDLGVVRICLASRDIKRDYAHLSDQGVSFLTAPQPCTDGMADIATCLDPDGTLIEMIQVHLDKWPHR